MLPVSWRIASIGFSSSKSIVLAPSSHALSRQSGRRSMAIIRCAPLWQALKIVNKPTGPHHITRAVEGRVLWTDRRCQPKQIVAFTIRKHRRGCARLFA